jgi:hypothetical protein
MTLRDSKDSEIAMKVSPKAHLPIQMRPMGRIWIGLAT